jgi:methylated-DNA-[protein]-cysteine S-methyltransferase
MSRADTESIKRALSGDVGAEAAAAAARFADRADREDVADVAYASFESPFGTGRIAVTERGIVSVGLPNLSEGRFLEQISSGLSPRVLELPRRLDEARRELEQYFAGRRREFELEVDWRLVRRGFYGRVLRNTAKLPFGITSTYGEIAARSGNPRAYRAAGTALGSNPIPIVVPCHRVLRAGGAIGDYGGGPEMKRRLLELEGALRS